MHDKAFEVETIIQDVLAKLNMAEADNAQRKESGDEGAEVKTNCTLTEFVGTAKYGNTIGLVIANVDNSLLEKMELEEKYYSLGIMGARTGAGSGGFPVGSNRGARCCS